MSQPQIRYRSSDRRSCNVISGLGIEEGSVKCNSLNAIKLRSRSSPAANHCICGRPLRIARRPPGLICNETKKDRHPSYLTSGDARRRRASLCIFTGVAPRTRVTIDAKKRPGPSSSGVFFREDAYFRELRMSRAVVN